MAAADGARSVPAVLLVLRRASGDMVDRGPLGIAVHGAGWPVSITLKRLL